MTKPVLILTFVLCASLGAVAQPRPPRQAETGPARGQAANQDQPKPEPPINITVATPEPGPAENEAQRQRADRQDATNERIAKLAFWLVIVGALDAIAIAIGLGYTARAANAAKTSAVAAEAALTKLQRPFLSVNGWKYSVHYNPLPDGRPTNVRYFVTPIIVNNGATPTVDMDLIVEYAGRDSLLPIGFEFPFSELPRKCFIGPRGSCDAVSGGIPAEEMVRIQSGSRQLYVWGQATYRDIFDGTPTHHLRFCYRITQVFGDPMRLPTPAHPNEPKLTWMWWMHEEHNDSD